MQKLYWYTFLKRDEIGNFCQNWIVSVKHVEQAGFILSGIKSIKLKNELHKFYLCFRTRTETKLFKH